MSQSGKNEAIVFFTGGHGATAALAVAQKIVKKDPNTKIYWLGVKNAFEGGKETTLESQSFGYFGVKFLPIIFGRLQRKFTLYTIPSLLKIPVGFIQSLYYIIKFRPRVILSFGGFASFGVVFWGWVLGIPVVLHEQTTRAGRASILSSFFARRILISRKESFKYFPENKTVLTGNPVMEEVFKVRRKYKPSYPPVLFITGGSRGSRAINLAVKSGIRTLLAKYRIIHQTGKLGYSEFSQLRDRLPHKLKENYQVYANIKPQDMPTIYADSDVVIGRAGANTVSEIIAVGRPAVLIPLPLSYLDEQTENAKFAQRYGVASVLPQTRLNSETLLKSVAERIENYGDIVKTHVPQSPDWGAAGKIYEELSQYSRTKN